MLCLTDHTYKMSIKIHLDNYSNNECFSGQTLLGRVECTFNNKKSFEAISIKFYGRAKTEWHVPRSYYDPVTKKTVRMNFLPYHAEETYVIMEFNLLEAKSGNLIVSTGQHFYPFSINLPNRLPGSFERHFGNIRYYIEAIVVRPWKFNYKAKIPLNVVSPMDLNFMPAVREPMTQAEDTSTRSRWGQKMGVLTFKLSVPVTGYVPGQEIKMMSYIQNKTKLTVKSVKFKVIANYEYTSYHPKTSSKRESTVIAKCVEGNSVGAHEEKSWTSTLLLPADHIYPNISTSNIISLSYILKAEAVLPFPNNNLKLEFPITIGSIALSEVNAVGPALPGYAAPYNYNIPTEMYNSDSLPPPYSSVSGERGNVASAPKDMPSSYSFETSTMPTNFIPSYTSTADHQPSSPCRSAQFFSPFIKENSRKITTSASPAYEQTRL